MSSVRNPPVLTTSDKLLFLQHVSKVPTETGCLLWLASKSAEGYGHHRVGKESWGAHRLAYWIAKGATIPGQLIRHTCDNPQCCNPEHLIPGTHADNMKDRVVRGRPMLRKTHGIDGVRYISTAEAGRQLGIGPRRVAQLCEAGIIKGRRLGPRSWWQVEAPVSHRISTKPELSSQ